MTFPPEHTPRETLAFGVDQEDQDHVEEASHGGRTDEQLRQADVELAKGSSIAAVCRLLAISEQTFHRWRNQRGIGGHFLPTF